VAVAVVGELRRWDRQEATGPEEVGAPVVPPLGADPAA
jgi:hypothetical protein